MMFRALQGSSFRLSHSARRIIQSLLTSIATGRLFFRCHFRGLDQFPEFRVLLKHFVLLHFYTGTEKEILESMTIENAVDDQAQLVPFEINAVIAHAEPMQCAAGAFELAELIHLRVHD